MIAARRKTTPLSGARIIIVLSELEMGGAERQALLLAQYLIREQKAEVEIWGLQGQPGRVARVCEEHGIPWRLVPLAWCASRGELAKRLLKFARSLRGARPDVILPYLIMPNVACGLVWRLTGARTCIWNQRDRGLGRLTPKAERLAVRGTPLFISNSAQAADFLVQTLNAPRERVRIIHNGIQLAQPLAGRAAWRNRLGISEDTFAACMVGNLTELKDHDTLLRAWRLVIDGLAASGRSAVLLLAGHLESSGSTHHSSKAMAYDLELGQSVRFLGQVQDVSGLLSAVDLGVFSSRSESSPNGVLECMAAGLVVAGTDIQGIREAVGPEGEQFLAPPGDAKALAENILRLAAVPELRAGIGAANRLRIETEFSPEHMCEQVLALMIEGLQGKS